ncbi:GNAT family N-acetyltransferase, partial [Campylobacter jejuni]|nr:GNAT family N-acetyltransferase [Campylobacter jejuni]EAH6156539.1 GNAT family N-acetyltransferase [Campylobacter jejuni]EAH7228521.1 GNAT family N-acetyltransferase [Campylobacter jejuni]EAI3560026.1 GNAT family N-acetyltransferase [Campylobacter jejuni]EAL0997303.1 GNAT family N-acetyltransferase [Campylobacter jejuni]
MINFEIIFKRLKMSEFKIIDLRQEDLDILQE